MVKESSYVKNDSSKCGSAWPIVPSNTSPADGGREGVRDQK